MAQIFGTQERVYYLGDSISAEPPNEAWFNGGTGFQVTVAAMVTSPVTPSVTAPSGAFVCTPTNAAVVTVNAATGGNHSRIAAYGQGNRSGQNIAQINASRGTCVSFAPTVVLIEAGTNNTAGAQSDVESLISNLVSEIPGVKLWWISVMCRGSEKNPDPNAGTINNINNSIIAGIANGHSAQVDYIDVRTPQLAYEAIHNTPSPGSDSGILTLDGTHLNSTGQAWYSGQVAGAITYS